MRRRFHNRSGGGGTPAEVVLRLLLLKHVRNWSYAVLEREVRANLVYRQFTRVGAAKVPDAKTLGKLGVALGPQIVERIHRRVVAIAQEQRIVRGRRMRVDTTVVETDIHYPTDSSLLGDGVRVLTRAMKRIGELACAAGAKLRDRTKSARRYALQISRICRSRTEQGKERLQQCYRRLLSITGRVVGQAKRFVREVVTGIKHSDDLIGQMAIEGNCVYLETMIARVQHVMQQTRDRIFGGDPRTPGKLVSLFEPHTEIIRKVNAAKPTEFGKLVKFQEAEQQIVTHYEVYDQRPNDSDLLVPALQIHERQFGQPPRLLTADAGFFSARNEAAARERGVKRIAIPNLGTKSAERKKLQKKRWFREAQKWRTGCEGRISLLKRRHGLNRCRYKGPDGIKRWVGLDVIADNLINIGPALAARPAR
ncbi:transposase [Burkholderiales bacterium]|jgi:IS5 family transposase|nr:transposase [Burkholderiales bacterium]